MGDNFCDFLFALLHMYTKGLLEGVYSKREDFAPREQILSFY